MSKPFDATPKGLVELRPADWPAFVGVEARAVEVVDADVSTVTAAADKVLLVHSDAGDRIQHFDFQSGPDASVPRRTHGYSALLEERHQLPVDSVVVLLHPKANLRAINGVYDRRLPGETEPYLRFRYRVIRVWELPVEIVLQAGISVLPLAPISAVREDELPAVIERMGHRFTAVPDRTQVAELWTATGVLLGMRYQRPFVESLLRGVRGMEESTFYQAILEKGRLQEARRLLLRVGEDRFGAAPTPEQQAVIESLTDPGRIEELVVRAAHVESWAELLRPPSSPESPRRRKRR